MSAADGFAPLPDWFTADAAVALRDARARRRTAMADLFTPAEHRLRDDDRAFVAAALTELVDGIEQALRRRIASRLTDQPLVAAMLADKATAVARPILDRAGLLRDGELIAAFTDHAARERLAARLRRALPLAREVEPEYSVTPAVLLAEDADPAIAQAARALIAAPADVLLPADARHRLIWRVAAALRHALTTAHAVSAAVVDPLVTGAAVATLADDGEPATAVSRALSLARALARAERLDGALAVHAVAAGEPVLAAAVLAVRAAIDFAPAWSMMTDPTRLLPLARAAGLSQPVAADLAVRLDAGENDDALAARIESYPALLAMRADAVVGLWRSDGAYLDALADLAGTPPA